MNRNEFFRVVKTSLFQGRLGAKQVEGMNLLLDVQAEYFHDLPADRLAYCLATAFHETGARMQPIKEIGGNAYFTRMYDIRGNRPKVARALGNIHPGDGAKYPGMGFVQSTGRANARKARKVIYDVLGEDIDFEAKPEKLMVPLYSAVLLFYGMIHGVFTGRDLDDFIDGDGKEDPGEFKNARRIINGRDREHLIAGYGRLFLYAIQKAEQLADDDEPIDDVTTGKPLMESKTVGATLLGTAVGGIATGKQIIETAREAADVASQANDLATEWWDVLTMAAPWILALLAILVAAWVVIRERRRKSLELGI